MTLILILNAEFLLVHDKTTKTNKGWYMSDSIIFNGVFYCFSYRETPAGSNRSSPTATEDVASSRHSIVQGDLWGTGNTTERSSVDSQYSWDVSDYKLIILLVEHWLSIRRVAALISVFGGYILSGRKCPTTYSFDVHYFILTLNLSSWPLYFC